MGSALPGAGNVTCDKAEGATFGICRNAMGCSPQGNVCHVRDYVCSVSAASNNCCGLDLGPGNEQGECQLDLQGVPRCTGLDDVCLENGTLCAMNADCCSRACQPSQGQLRCVEGETCLVDETPCSATSECCAGLLCQRQGSQVFGTCSQNRSGLSCALAGQTCEEETDCCGSATCEEGRCESMGSF